MPLEVQVLDAALALQAHGEREFHGYQLASAIRERAESRSLTAHGTLYKALDRMRIAGLLTSRWEDPEIAAAAQRPLRRLYSVTPAGDAALAHARALAAASVAAVRSRVQPA